MGWGACGPHRDSPGGAQPCTARPDPAWQGAQPCLRPGGAVAGLGLLPRWSQPPQQSDGAPQGRELPHSPLLSLRAGSSGRRVPGLLGVGWRPQAGGAIPPLLLPWALPCAPSPLSLPYCRAWQPSRGRTCCQSLARERGLSQQPLAPHGQGHLLDPAARCEPPAQSLVPATDASLGPRPAGEPGQLPAHTGEKNTPLARVPATGEAGPAPLPTPGCPRRAKRRLGSSQVKKKDLN